MSNKIVIPYDMTSEEFAKTFITGTETNIKLTENVYLQNLFIIIDALKKAKKVSEVIGSCVNYEAAAGAAVDAAAGNLGNQIAAYIYNAVIIPFDATTDIDLIKFKVLSNPHFNLIIAAAPAAAPAAAAYFKNIGPYFLVYDNDKLVINLTANVKLNDPSKKLFGGNRKSSARRRRVKKSANKRKSIKNIA